MMQEKRATEHLKNMFGKIREGYNPKGVEKSFITSYERILNTLDGNKAKEVAMRLRPIFTARAKAIGVASVAADIGLTAVLAGLTLKKAGIDRLGRPAVTSVNKKLGRHGIHIKNPHHIAGTAVALGVGLLAPVHRGAQAYAKAEGFAGEKVAHIVNDIVSGKIIYKDIGRYKMNTVRVGVGKPA